MNLGACCTLQTLFASVIFLLQHHMVTGGDVRPVELKKPHTPSSLTRPRLPAATRAFSPTPVKALMAFGRSFLRRLDCDHPTSAVCDSPVLMGTLYTASVQQSSPMILFEPSGAWMAGLDDPEHLQYNDGFQRTNISEASATITFNGTAIRCAKP